ncbi:MAG: FAD-dependent oxidoreductase [Putridiphycobacter sp.]|nr:FAD-dependent oxidoreductase [Putridiphycobacter sp.]
MNKEDYNIHIIGAGISGLIAATVLENNGYKPIILDNTDRAGGRVKTDIVEGYQLDHGFQVLLTAYPAAQKYLNYEALELQPFLPGAAIFTNGTQKIIGDPLRNLGLLFPTLRSGIGNITDKIKILQLNAYLKKTSIAAIFSAPEKTTHQYLVDFGFSETIITTFFKPFFSGIYLEPDLNTSSRMFEFVYKMFGEGNAALPKAGIEAIPQQLKANLKYTQFQFNQYVIKVTDNQIFLKNGTALPTDFTIIATEPSQLIENLRNQEAAWKGCDTLYFEANKKVIKKPLIGLVASKNALINNIFFHNSLNSNSSGQKELLSVTVVKNHNLSNAELIETVKEELAKYCGIDSIRFLKHYAIPKALPNLSHLKFDVLPSETRLTDTIFLAGDIQLNGSLNAAINAGEKAALGIIEKLSNTMV